MCPFDNSCLLNICSLQILLLHTVILIGNVYFGLVFFFPINFKWMSYANEDMFPGIQFKYIYKKLFHIEILNALKFY